MLFFRSSISSSRTPSTSSILVASSSILSSSTRNCSAAATATTTSSDNESSRFVDFSQTTFIMSQVDYCAKLAGEANKKHNVPLNVPPQACPSTFDHSVVYCDSLQARSLDPSGFAYPVQFEPPPKHIPGMETPKTEHQIRAEQMQQNLHQIKKKAEELSKQDPTKKTVGRLLGSADQNPFKLQKYSDIHNVGEGVKSESFDEYVKKMQKEKKPLDIDYPTDDEIDTLLLQVWDPVVSKRVPEFLKKNPKFTFKEAKDYEVVDLSREEGKTTRLKVSEAVLRGESNRPKQEGIDPEHQVHFETPFTLDAARNYSSSMSATDDDGENNNLNRLMPPKLSKYSDKKAFPCGECSLTFRTYDAIKLHYLNDHKKSIPVLKDLEYRDASLKQQNSANVAPSSSALLASKLQSLRQKNLQLKQEKENELKLQQLQQERQKEATEEKGENGEITGEEKDSKSQEEKQQQSTTTTTTTTLTGEAAIKATPIPEVDISLHSRSPFNIQLLGVVRQIQTGYAGRDFVAELLVETSYNNNSNDDGDDNVKDDSKKDNKNTVPVDDEFETKDVFTVRCFGEDFANLTANSVAEDCRVLVQGTYKSNLHVDRASGKPQCYPFVKVVQPYGNVTVIQ